ncbi:hypothetical protein ACFLYX_01900 [Chloroflexota bacterium]
MSKKFKVITSVLVAVVLLTAGGATTVMAQKGEIAPAPAVNRADIEPVLAEGTDNVTGTNSLLARVAELLGISPEELADIFKEARQALMQETMTTRLEQYLEKAVAEGLIDENEAAEIMTWWENRPEALDNLKLSAKIFSALDGRQNDLAPRVDRSQVVPGRQRLTGLDETVEKGRITNEQAERLRERKENMTGVQDDSTPRPRIAQAKRFRQQIAVPRNWTGPVQSEESN